MSGPKLRPRASSRTRLVTKDHLEVHERISAVRHAPPLLESAPCVESARTRIGIVGVEPNRIRRPFSREDDHLLHATPPDALTLKVRANGHIRQIQRARTRREI